MPEDTRHVIADYYRMDTNETTILRHEQIRLREAVIEGTTDADSLTDVSLVGLPNNIEIIAVIGQILEGSSWEVYDNRCANDAADSFRVLVIVTNPTRAIRFTEVGADKQGRKYRIWLKYIERI